MATGRRKRWRRRRIRGKRPMISYQQRRNGDGGGKDGMDTEIRMRYKGTMHIREKVLYFFDKKMQKNMQFYYFFDFKIKL